MLSKVKPSKEVSIMIDIYAKELQILAARLHGADTLCYQRLVKQERFEEIQRLLNEKYV